MKTLVVIPARYDSTRFPGKPIRAIINGKPMIELTYKQAEKSSADEVMVATDDKRIYDVVKSFGGNVVMTATYHKTGTERLLEVSSYMNEFDGYINVQGDEPFIDPSQINNVIDMMSLRPNAVATLHAECKEVKDLYDSNIIKQVVAKERVLYTSRNPIPWLGRNNWDTYKYHIHIGIYGFPINVIKELDLSYETTLQKMENLEQLNWMSNGIEMYSRLSEWNIGINSPEDLKRAGGIIKE
jgi:3-deoxy-manno-octulosonate cytidylyltransferase (CMP-KDO synthetase)